MTMRSVIGMLVVLLATAGCASSTSTGGGTGAASGTLDRIKATKTLNLGYRDSSVPFSFVGTDQKPTGYSVELCQRVADDLKRDLQIPDLAVKWTLVTVENRMAAVQNGTIDLECGSTTNTLSRQAQVDFSLTTFVTGASLLALKETATANLSGLRIAVIPGTTTERILKEAMDKSSTPVTLIPVKRHADGRAALEQKTADAYASDREILIGLVLTVRSPGSLLPFEPGQGTENASFRQEGFLVEAFWAQKTASREGSFKPSHFHPADLSTGFEAQHFAGVNDLHGIFIRSLDGKLFGLKSLRYRVTRNRQIRRKPLSIDGSAPSTCTCSSPVRSILATESRRSFAPSPLGCLSATTPIFPG